MKAYTSDEIGYEIREYDIPDRLCATGPEHWVHTSNNEMQSVSWGPIRDAHLIGAVEGWIARDFKAEYDAFERDNPWEPDPEQPGMLMRKYRLTDGSGFIEERKGADYTELPDDGWNGVLDDDEYPAHRAITRFGDGTLFLQARFGRNKNWVLAINRDDDAAAKRAVERWIGVEVRDEVE